MAIGGVVINFAARTRDAVTDVDKLSRAVGNVGDTAKTTSGRMGKLGGAMKAGVAAGAAAAATGIVVLANVMWDAGMAALEDQKTADKLANTLRTLPGVTEDAIAANESWITSMQLSTHVADTDLRAAVGKLALATGDLGEAQRLAAAAADLSTISGKSYSTVADAMTKAATGNETALKRIAPWLDVNRDGTITLSEALGELEGKYADASEAAAEQDAWTTLKVIWDELKESLGQWILPLVKKFGDWFKDPANQKAIQTIIDKVGKLSTELGEKLLPAIEDFLDWVSSKKGQEDMRRWAGYIEDTAGAVASLFSWFDRLKGLSPLVLLDEINRLLGKTSSTRKAVGLPSPAAASATGATTRAAAPVTVNISMTGAFNDPYGNARAIKRLLEGEDVRQGRDRGQKLAVAW